MVPRQHAPRVFTNVDCHLRHEVGVCRETGENPTSAKLNAQVHTTPHLIDFADPYPQFIKILKHPRVPEKLRYEKAFPTDTQTNQRSKIERTQLYDF